MGEDDSDDRLPAPQPGMEWAVACPRHGARAHLYLEGLEKTPPDLRHCSLRPGELPPVCSHACLQDIVPAASDSELDDLEDLEETVVDDA